MHKIGIMGGTFDPIHYGHLVVAEEARWQFKLKQVVFIPAGHPPHKTPGKITEARHRLAMVQLAIQGNSFFVASDMEIQRPGLSYTVNTVRELRKNGHFTDIFFIVGADTILEILSWKQFDELLNTCFFIAAKRPGFRLEKLKTKLTGLTGGQLKRIIAMKAPLLAISSTDIRERVRTGRTIKYLLPENVEKYIFDNKLYKKEKK